MQTVNLLIARLFYPETFPSKPFSGAKLCGALVTLIGLSTLAMLVLS